MRTNVNLWWILTAFSMFIAAVYVVWNIISHGGVEWVGTVALVFMGLMSAMIGLTLPSVFFAVW